MSDETRAPRPGEELPDATLAPYVRQAIGAAADAPVAVRQFPGGHSNLTYLVTVGDTELVLRRPPFGSKVKSAHDMGREVRVLSALAPVFPLAPRPLAFCEDESVIGARFYLMERRRGTILRRDLPRGVTLDPAQARRLGEAFVDALAELHALSPAAVGLGDLGNPVGYVERQVTGWSKRYQAARTDDIPDMERVAGWLAANLPPGEPAEVRRAATIVHNDFKYDNLVLAEDDLTRPIAILDWEMATVGDPLTDLGTALCYWVQADDPPDYAATRFVVTHLPGSLTRRELVARYAERTGRDVSRVAFYYALGLFKTAVVAQQIYYRYRQGLTQDPRFAAIGMGVVALAAQARRVIDGAA
jgi:aminoglycoside phosphotransferase (APT) family kinase protein